MESTILDLAHDQRFTWLVYGQPEPPDIHVLNAWLKKARALPSTYDIRLRLYAALTSETNWSDTGAAPTHPGSTKQDAANYIHLYTTPAKAIDEALRNKPAQDLCIYQCDIDLRRAAPNLHGLRELRRHATLPGNGITLAESLCLHGSARHKGPITKDRISIYGHWNQTLHEIIKAPISAHPEALSHWPTPTHWAANVDTHQPVARMAA